MRIYLKDNNCGNYVEYRKNVAALFPISNKTIAELCQENENLLIFPHNIENAIDRIGDSCVMDIINTADPEKVNLCTGNIMGFIGVGDLQIKIASRFDKGEDDYFLHYMLQKVLSFNFFDLNHNNEKDDVFDLIMLMFPYFLKNAMRQGLYREYQYYKHNDTNIRGTINIGRHISKNIPFVGNIAYSTREYSYDNNMTELIRHTIEFMKNNRYGQAVLNIDHETINGVNNIIEHTYLYNKSERENIISKNLRMKIHPFYTEYHPLQILCLQILRMEEVKYGEKEENICGILFDGAWLWEEYVNTILRDLGFTHPQNKTKKGGISLFQDGSGRRYPDFYNKEMVLDAKYKRLNNYSKVSKVNRDDLHQLIAYLVACKVKKGGFVAPFESKQTYIPTSYLKDGSSLLKDGSSLSILGIEICNTAKTYKEFCESMKKNEKEFVSSIKSL